MASGSFKVVVPVDRVASAVAVSWESTLEASEGAEIWISEVLVLRKQPNAAPEVKEVKEVKSPAKLGSGKPLPQNDFSTSVQMHNFAEANMVQGIGEMGAPMGVLSKNGSQMRAHWNHFLSPFPTQPTGLRFSLKASLGALLALVLLAFKYKSHAEKAFGSCLRDYESYESYEDSRDEEREALHVQTVQNMQHSMHSMHSLQTSRSSFAYDPLRAEESDVESRARSPSETASEPEGEPEEPKTRGKGKKERSGA